MTFIYNCMILFLCLVSEPTKNIENNLIQVFLKNLYQSKLPASSIYGSILLLMTEG